MPFTLVHPVAVLPIWYASGQRLRLAALVVGSTAPDYEYFLQMQPSGSFGHTTLGLFVFCLPVGWVALWLFDRFAKRGIETLLPPRWRLPPAPLTHHSALSISGALLLGSGTHIAWDAFTHRTGVAVALLPALSSTIAVGSLNAPWYKILQHGSTIVGMLVLTWLAVRWALQQPSVPRSRLAMRAVAIASIPLAIGLLNGARFLSQGFQEFVVATGVAFTFVVALGPVVLGALSHDNREDVT